MVCSQKKERKRGAAQGFRCERTGLISEWDRDTLVLDGELLNNLKEVAIVSKKNDPKTETRSQYRKKTKLKSVKAQSKSARNLGKVCYVCSPLSVLVVVFLFLSFLRSRAERCSLAYRMTSNFFPSLFQLSSASKNGIMVCGEICWLRIAISMHSSQSEVGHGLATVPYEIADSMLKLI